MRNPVLGLPRKEFLYHLELHRRRSTRRGEQLELPLNWGAEPWEGRSPRSLSRGSCVIEKSVVESESGDATEDFTDAAQLTLFPEGNPYG